MGTIVSWLAIGLPFGFAVLFTLAGVVTTNAHLFWGGAVMLLAYGSTWVLIRGVEKGRKSDRPGTKP